MVKWEPDNLISRRIYYALTNLLSYATWGVAPGFCIARRWRFVHMSFDDARVFIKRVKEKTGRYPLIYANNEVTKAITAQYAADETFSQRTLVGCALLDNGDRLSL